MSKIVHAALIAAALALSSTALAAPRKGGGCPEGKVKAHGECVEACPTTGSFDPKPCECPAGFGKILDGAGHGECRRLACVTGSAIEDPAHCDCPTGYEKKRAQGVHRCVPGRARATAAK